jgi:hypothetical protein
MYMYTYVHSKSPFLSPRRLFCFCPSCFKFVTRFVKRVFQIPDSTSLRTTYTHILYYSGKHTIVAIKKMIFFFFDVLVLSGTLGQHPLRFRATITFFFGIAVFFVPGHKSRRPNGWRQTILCLPESCVK